MSGTFHQSPDGSYTIELFPPGEVVYVVGMARNDYRYDATEWWDRNHEVKNGLKSLHARKRCCKRLDGFTPCAEWTVEYLALKGTNITTLLHHRLDFETALAVVRGEVPEDWALASVGVEPTVFDGASDVGGVWLA